MAKNIYDNDPVIRNIDMIIEKIKEDAEIEAMRKIPSREEILNTHLAFIRTALLH